ncbi:aminomethyltransferase family protein [Thalassotalea fonticola]|uniref:Aminomethyltransferase family protein n=1 Tax=Thalassotalea fonticola TaxID=3065649 RepID=A0ABZ0GMH6_9GAMM|nr:aminomethyltransferase family protein [Colwelliaceae bacterium S1-1]
MNSNNSNTLIKTAKDINHTLMTKRRSPFDQRISAMNLSERWIDWNGYRTPEYYFDAFSEYMATRNACAVFDNSPMCKYRIKGKDTERMLNRMVTRDVAQQGFNRVAYNVWCDDSGKVIDDGTLFRLSQDEFIIFCAEPAMDWFMLSAVGFADIEITDESHNIAGLALQGPTSCALLKALNITDVELLKPFDIGNFNLETQSGIVELMISRTGFTGDLGYELWVDPSNAIALWDILFSKGDLYGIQPLGDEPLGVARLEAGFLLPELEFHGALHTVNLGFSQSPFELGLDWIVNFKKAHFNGRAALLKEKQQGSKFKLTKLDIEGNKPADGSFLYSDKACTKEIGYVTSAAWSSALKQNIAYAFIKGDYVDGKSTKGKIWAEIYYQKELRWQHKIAECTVQVGAFWAPKRAKQTPPPDC